MKTLLIPTDFELKSLECISKLSQQYYPQKLNIILVHMLKVTDSITELLMLSKRSIEYQKISSEFHSNCDELKKQYKDQINSLRVQFFYGNTLASFDNFLEANGVDEIVILENYEYKKTHKNSILPEHLLSRCGLKIVTINEKQKVVNMRPEKIQERAVQEEVYKASHYAMEQNS